MISLFKTATVELQTTPAAEVVKVAGILRRLKNFFKKLTDKEYADAVDQLQMDSTIVGSTASELNEKINHLLSAIKDSDLIEYNNALEEVKTLSLKMVDDLRRLNKDVKTNTLDAKRPLTSEEQEQYIKHYTKEDIENNRPQILEQLIKQKPPEHDVEFGDYQQKPPLQEFNWFKSFTSNDVFISEKLQGLLKKSLKVLVEKIFKPETEEESDKLVATHWNKFLEEFRKSIINGRLLSYHPAEPNTTITHRPAGQADMKIVTDQFEILPGVMGNAYVRAMDMGPTSLRKHISLRLLLNFEIFLNGIKYNLAKTSSMNKTLMKKVALGQEVPAKTTQLNDLEFAKVMAAGYQKAFGRAPSLEILGGGWAQAVLEGGRAGGHVNLPNNNVGNIKATEDWIKAGHSYFVKDTKEFTPEGEGYTHAGAKWRSYQTPIEGAAAYWNLLGNKFGEALNWYSAGDPISATVVLGKKGYYTANIKQYAGTTGQLYQEFMKKIAPQLPEITSQVTAPPSATKPELIEFKNKPQTILDESDQLLSTLLSYQNSSVTSLVKKALIPQATVVVSLSSLSAPFEWRLKYAQAAVKTLRDIIEADTSIHTDGHKIELQCRAAGNTFTVASAINGLCDCLSESLALRTTKLGNIKIDYVVLPNTTSNYQKMDLA